MRKYKRSAALLLAMTAAAVIASAVSAQNPERRERLRRAAGAARAVVGAVNERIEDSTQLWGRVLVLQELGNEVVGEQPASPQDNSTLPDQEVNNGGLVIVEFNDTQSRPTQFDPPRIEPDGAFEPLGKVRGVAMQDGKPLMGGGHTWLLLKPVKIGAATITVTYTPNGGDGQPVTRSHKVMVTDAEPDVQVEEASFERAK